MDNNDRESIRRRIGVFYAVGRTLGLHVKENSVDREFEDTPAGYHGVIHFAVLEDTDQVGGRVTVGNGEVLKAAEREVRAEAEGRGVEVAGFEESGRKGAFKIRFELVDRRTTL